MLADIENKAEIDACSKVKANWADMCDEDSDEYWWAKCMECRWQCCIRRNGDGRCRECSEFANTPMIGAVKNGSNNDQANACVVPKNEDNNRPQDKVRGGPHPHVAVPSPVPLVCPVPPFVVHDDVLVRTPRLFTGCSFFRSCFFSDHPQVHAAIPISSSFSALQSSARGPSHVFSSKLRAWSPVFTPQSDVLRCASDKHVVWHARVHRLC